MQCSLSAVKGEYEGIPSVALNGPCCPVLAWVLNTGFPSVAQDCLQFVEVFLPRLPTCWDYQCPSPHWVCTVMRIRPPALCLPGRHSTSWATSSAPGHSSRSSSTFQLHPADSGPGGVRKASPFPGGAQSHVGGSSTHCHHRLSGHAVFRVGRRELGEGTRGWVQAQERSIKTGILGKYGKKVSSMEDSESWVVFGCWSPG